jgi:GTP-binding protein
MNLNNVIYVKSILNRRDTPQLPLPEVVILGRSNVGKSSLINTVLQRRNLARTSSTPGKTRLINYFLIDQQLYLVDLPGYGYIKKKDPLSEKWEHLLGDFLLKNRRIKLVLVLIDSRHPELPADSYSISWLIRNRIPFVLVLTKYDKLSKRDSTLLKKKIESVYPQVKVIPFSAKDRTGREDIVDLLQQSISCN